MSVAAHLAKNVAMGIPAVRRWRAGRARTLPGADPELLDRYAFKQLDLAERVAGPLAGRSVLEFGPGDNLMTGLAFLAAGAASYSSIDRFAPTPGDARARAWYRALHAAWPHRYPGRPWPAALSPETFPAGAPVIILDRPVEDVRDIGHYDLVFSHAVAEHVLDPAALARQTLAALAPGGVAIHLVDFSGHDWDIAGDRLRFLRFPEPLWRAMGSNRGAPNRVSFDTYLAHFRAAGLAVAVEDVLHFEEPNLRPAAGVVVDRFVREATFVLRRPDAPAP